MTNVRSCSASFLVLVCGLAMVSCKHSEVPRMSVFQPGESEPSDPVAPLAKRVTVGAVVEPGGTLPTTGDKYMHFQSSSDYATPLKCKPEGFRAVCGPFGAVNATSVKVVTNPKTHNGSTFDHSPEINGGFATLWGWRPYIRLQRISAAAEGSWIIVEVRPNSVERILLVRSEPGAPMLVWDNTTPAAGPTTVPMNSGTFVDVSPRTDGTLDITTPLPISGNPEAAALLVHATGKMK